MVGNTSRGFPVSSEGPVVECWDGIESGGLFPDGVGVFVDGVDCVCDGWVV